VFDWDTSKRKKTTTTPTNEPGVAVTQEERRACGSRGEAACGFGWAGPLRLAGEKLARGLLRPSGPNAEEGQQQAFGPKTVKSENFYFPFFF
jgi:hypothetical protein